MFNICLFESSMVLNLSETLELLRSSEKNDRAKAASYLGSLGANGVEAASLFLADSDWHLRYRACEIIGLTHEKSGIPYLLPLLKDEKDHVRYMAVKSLGFCGGKEIVPYITPLLDDENSFVVRITKEVLQRIS